MGQVAKRSSGRRMKVAAHKFPPEMIRRLGLLAERTGCSRGAIVRAGLERELAYREAGWRRDDGLDHGDRGAQPGGRR